MTRHRINPKELLSWLKIAELVWLEDFDHEMSLRIVRKRAGYRCATRLGQCVFLEEDGTTRNVGFVKLWHAYKFGKDPMEYIRERENREEMAKAQARMTAIAHMQMKQMASLVNPYVPMQRQMVNPNHVMFGATPKFPSLAPEITLVHPVTGWRRWSIDMFGSMLKSNNGTKWEPYKRVEAECKSGHECNGILCSCGIYAYKNRTDSQAGENAATSETHIWGEVYLWGRIVEHETGYRAQYAYPKAFINTGGIAEQLATAYGVKMVMNEVPSEEGA